MTICFKDYPAMKKFMANVFTGSHRDNIYPVFDLDFTTNFMCKQITYPRTHETEEMEKFLKAKRIEYNWVNQF